MTSFEDLGLGPKILKAIAECGYTEPTPIQAQAIPPILMMRDIVGLAQTGTGKTAGFVLPMLEVLHGGRARARMPRSLILTPTRELAAQIAENFDTYGKYSPLEKALLIGGTSMDKQMKRLDKGVDVLIATPGRLLDLFERGSILLNDIKILAIDEADRMLDMGFIPDIEKIISLLPFTRQTLLFSATMPPEIQKLADRFLSSPKQISVAARSKPAETVDQRLMWVQKKDKKKALSDLIKNEKVKNAFVFCNRKRDISGVARWLADKGFEVAPMHGDLPQSQRNETLQEFKDGKITFMICSDVAARGIDVDAVSHVFNFDVPMNAEDYVHRIGRTGRAGMDGHAWTLAVKGDDDKFVKAIERLIKREIPEEKSGGKSSSTSSRRPDPKRSDAPKANQGKNKPDDQKHKKSQRKEHIKSDNQAQKKKPAEKGGSPESAFEDHVPDFMRR